MKKKKKENSFQPALIKKLKAQFPGCYVMKNDANYKQGFPDLSVLLPNGLWAQLECKRAAEEVPKKDSNQLIYINDLSTKGFARFIYPENEEEVLNDLRRYSSRIGEQTCNI